MIACWCQREETPEAPLTPTEKEQLQFLYDEWAHPYFISNLEFGRLMEVTSQTNQTGPDGLTFGHRLPVESIVLQWHMFCGYP